MITSSSSSRSFDLRRLFSYARRESLELRRDPIRATLAVLGSVLLLFIMGYGISMDVEDLTFAVLDRDQTTTSRDYTLGISGSRYFIEQPPISDYDELDRRMRSGEVSLAIEIPSGFTRDLLAGRQAQIGAWVDGAMPQRAETLQGYVQGMHQHWVSEQISQRLGTLPVTANIQTRFRYNPDVRSLPAMVPAIIPLLLLMIPAMLTALAVEKSARMPRPPSSRCAASATTSAEVLPMRRSPETISFAPGVAIVSRIRATSLSRSVKYGG